MFFIKNLNVNELINEKEQAMTSLHSISLSLNNLKDFEIATRIFEIKNIDKLKLEKTIISPTILRTSVVRELIQYLQQQGSSNCTCLKRIKYSIIYHFFLLKKGIFIKYHFEGNLFDKTNEVTTVSQALKWKPEDSFQSGSLLSAFQSHLEIPKTIPAFMLWKHFHSNLPSSSLKKISAMMVTKNRLERAKIAIKCFQDQIYSNKELVIICDANDGLEEYVKSLNDSDIKFYRIENNSMTLGELRNLAVEKSTGYYLAQWDDDDWYHPSRLIIQVLELEFYNADACMLSSWLMVWPSQNTFVMTHPREDGWEGSMSNSKRKNASLSISQKIRRFGISNCIKKKRN